MANQNAGPERSDPPDPDASDGSRRSNPASAFLADTSSGVIDAAQARAATVSHRFGSRRYALTRRDQADGPADGPLGGEPDTGASREEPAPGRPDADG